MQNKDYPRLLNCPFCGGIPAVVEDGYKAIAVHCFNCGADITAESEKKARAAWNRRAQPANEPLTLEQLKQMDGEPVWIEDIENPTDSEWKIITWDRGKYLVLASIHCKGRLLDEYGKTWRAFAHKPGGEQE